MAICFQSPLKPTTFLSPNLSTTNNPKPSTFKCNVSLPTFTTTEPEPVFTSVKSFAPATVDRLGVFSLPTSKSTAPPGTAFTNLEVRHDARNRAYLFVSLDCAVIGSLREDADADGLRYLDDLCSNPCAHPGEVSSSETTGKLTAEGPVLALAPDTVAALGPGFEFVGAAGYGLDPGKLSISGTTAKLSKNPLWNCAGIAALPAMKMLGIRSVGLSPSLHKGLPLAYSADAVEDLILAGLESEVKVSGYHAHNIAPSIMGGFVPTTSFDPLELKRFTFPENTGGVVYMNGNKFPRMVSSFYGLQGNVLVIEQKRGSSRGLFPMPSSPLLWGNLRAIKPNRSSSLAKHFLVHSSSGGSSSGGSSSDGFGKSSEDPSKGPSHWLQFLPGIVLCFVAIGLGVLSYKGVLNKELFGEIKYFFEIVAYLLATIKAASMFNKNNS